MIESAIDMRALDAEINRQAERVESAIVRMLSYLGEQCLIKVRDRSSEASWRDRTGNLRASVGYIIVKDGRVIGRNGFDNSLGKSAHKEIVTFTTKDGKSVSYTTEVEAGGPEGASTGRAYAEDLAGRFSGEGYALIIVAGMNYASFVEARGRDVLAGAQLWAVQQFEVEREKLKKWLEGS